MFLQTATVWLGLIAVMLREIAEGVQIIAV